MTASDARHDRMPTRPSTRARTLAAPALACLWLVSGAVWAGPVDHDTSLRQSDPYELAARWTMASLPASMGGPATSLAALQLPSAVGVADAPPAAPPLRFTALPMAGGGAGVPDPGSYALVGLALLAAGLVVHQVRRARGGNQRGFSKNT